MITVDIKDRSHHLGIHKDHQKYLGMAWQGHFFVWMVFLFEASCSPYFFNRLIKPVVTFLRSNNIRVAAFVDDFYQMCHPKVTTDHKIF